MSDDKIPIGEPTSKSVEAKHLTLYQFLSKIDEPHSTCFQSRQLRFDDFQVLSFVEDLDMVFRCLPTQSGKTYLTESGSSTVNI